MLGPVGTPTEPSLPVRMPSWHLAYDTHAERGMSYGMLLWRHELPLSCFKEMAKVLAGIYLKAGRLAPEARYRMGVCCLALQAPQAAHGQWTLLRHCYPSARHWTQLAAQGQARLPQADRRDPPLMAGLTGAKTLSQLIQPPQTSFGQRFRVAEELFQAGLRQDDQCLLEYWKAMTVTDPSQKKNRAIRPLAEFKAGLCCRQSGREEAARRHFTAVLTNYPKHAAARLAAAALKREGER
jgi:hypothetical protein